MQVWLAQVGRVKLLLLDTSISENYLNPKVLIETLLNILGVYVYFGLFFIIFAETGLAIGFFLPGDSLLVVSGLMAKTLPDKLNVIYILIAFFVGSVLGDNTGYWTGRFMGKRLFNREDSWIFKPSRVEKAKTFFEKVKSIKITLPETKTAGAAKANEKLDPFLSIYNDTKKEVCLKGEHSQIQCYNSSSEHTIMVSVGDDVNYVTKDGKKMGLAFKVTEQMMKDHRINLSNQAKK